MCSGVLFLLELIFFYRFLSLVVENEVCFFVFFLIFYS